MNIFPDPIITLYQMAPFFVLLIGLNILVFQPMLKLHKERNRRVVGFASETDALNAAAQETRTEIEKRLAAAKAEAAAVRARLVQEAEAEAESIIAAARTDAEEKMAVFREKLQRTKDGAAAQLKAEAHTMSVEIATHVLGRPVA